MPDDLARTVRWGLRRWTPQHLWYRIRLPIRRRRWRLESERAAKPFARRDGIAPSDGPAVVFGDFSGSYGLARAALYDLAMLRKQHAILHEVDIHAILRGDRAPRALFAHAIENAYFLCQPDMLKSVLKLIEPWQIADAWRVGRWVWETPLFPADWAFAEALFHEVRAPSRFSAATFARALALPVHLAPYPVALPPDTGIDMRERLGIGKQTFMGLAIMDIISCPERKNPWAHVRAWKAAFGDDPSAVLLMKIRVGKRSKLVLKELAELIGPGRNVIVATQDLAADEIAALHHDADVFLSLHRSEGYGLNIHEALACGKPVVATHFSANAEYGPGFPTYRGIGYAMVPYRDWTAHYGSARFEWADADVGAAAAALREVRGV